MSNYWKQSLVIGGIYWLISLVLYFYGTVATLSADAFISILLLLFLIPMIWISPIKWLDKFMRKHPLIATWLASLGWVPYFIAVTFILTTIVVFVASVVMEQGQGAILYWSMLIGGWIVAIRQFVTLILFVGTVVVSLVYGKSIMGKLDDHYNISSETKRVKVAETKVKVETVKTPAKKMVKKVAKKSVAKSPKKKAPVAKKVAKKTTSKTVVKKPSAKTAKKNVAKK